jgi:4-hydroxybenzoate polyprenyltransferase
MSDSTSASPTGDPAGADAPSSQAAPLSEWLGLIRFSHTLFALPFAVLGTLMAIAAPLPDGTSTAVRPRDLFAILLCMVAARSAAMAFNRLVDHRIDAANPRTQNRHLPAGRLSRRSVALFTAGCCLAFVLATLIFLPNWVPLAASVPVLLFLLGYSLAKRFTSAAHLWLGVALSLSPICAWIALRGPQSVMHPMDLTAPTLLAFAVTSWVNGFDIIYACQDEAFDKQAGLHSVPSRFGIAGALRIAAASHGVMLLFLLALPFAASGLDLGWIYWIAFASITALVVRQHRLVRPDNLDRVNEAFFHANVSISLILMFGGGLDCFL